MSVFMRLKYKTKFKDKEMLKEAIAKTGTKCYEYQGSLTCNITYYRLSFEKDITGEYIINTQGYDDWKKDITAFRDKVEVYYNELMEKKEKKQLQKQIYDNIKTQVEKSPSMILEEEEILEDNSILLTITI